MKTSLAGMPAALFQDDVQSPVAFATRRRIKDPVGMWYAVRKRYGHDEHMWFGCYEGERLRPQWHTCSHRYCDSYGALALLLAERGQPGYRPPRARPTDMPDWRTLWRARKGVAAPAIAIGWKQLEPDTTVCVSHLPVSLLLSQEQSADIEQVAAAMGVSPAVWLLWTADRALRATLVEADSVSGWVYPVNLRGSVRGEDEYANHCSGLVLAVRPGDDAAACQRQLRERVQHHEHWRQWLMLTLGRWLGQPVINLLYRLIQAEPGRYAGSYSNLGEWNVPGLAGIACTAPGSPAYPVSIGTVLCNGRRSLSCRLHPVIGGDARRAIEFLKVWREFSLRPLVRNAHTAEVAAPA